jgi:myosin protein heavy chain
MSQRRNNPFTRAGSVSNGSPSGAGIAARPKSAVYPSPSPLSSATTPPSHNRNQSVASIAANLAPTSSNGTRHQRNDSKSGTPNSSTFAPSFIKTEDMRRSIDVVKGIEGENDFSGRRYVWLKDPQAAFVKGWIVEDLSSGRVLVQCDDGSVCVTLWSAHKVCQILTVDCSNERSMPRAWIRSTLPNSTRRTIWPS